jgi:hypothetical protein
MATPGSQVQLTKLLPGDSNCPAGGEQIDVGLPGDNGLVVQQTAYVCNGTNGRDADGGSSAGGAGGSSGSGSAGLSGGGGSGSAGNALQTIFVIVMENQNLSNLENSQTVPYINNVLLPQGAHAEQYFNPPGLHPSLPNYLWMEAGSNLGVNFDQDPTGSTVRQSTTDHLVSQLTNKGISWKAYLEDAPSPCPLSSSGLYAAVHVPFLYFDDVTNDSTCKERVRPYEELATDLSQASTTASYNFIVPNLCDDMHGTGGCPSNLATLGDTWLSTNVPLILGSAAYQNNGALFIVWDEGAGNAVTESDGPIGLIAMSPKAKPGYASTVHFDHSSLLKTIESVFGVPFLRGAAAPTTSDLGDLFSTFP